MGQNRVPANAPSHDPLLNRFREVRSRLTKFREVLQKQHNFDTDVGAAFRDADDEVWRLSQSHEREKSASRMTSSASEAQMEELGLLLEKWTRLCDLASAGEPVAFYVVSKEFGSAQNVPIGVTKAGADGTARTAYTPTWSGAQQFVVKLARPGTGATSATAEYRVIAFKPGPLSAGANPPRPLASVGHVFLAVILTIVALIWLSLLITLALAFGRLPRLASAEKN